VGCGWVRGVVSKKGGTHALIKGEFPNLKGKGDVNFKWELIKKVGKGV
jgi:hypothetical protein